MTRLVKNGEKISDIVGNLLELKISSLQNEPQHKKKIERKINNLHQLIHFCKIIHQTRSITSKKKDICEGQIQLFCCSSKLQI